MPPQIKTTTSTGAAALINNTNNTTNSPSLGAGREHNRHTKSATRKTTTSGLVSPSPPNRGKHLHHLPNASSAFSNTMSRPQGPVNPDGDSVMTSGTFLVMTRPDGSRGCVKHPHLTLEGWTCPECEKEFNEGHNALQQRKATLDNRLQELGQQQQQPPPQPPQSPMGPMSVPVPQQQPLYSSGAYGAPALAASPFGVNPMGPLNGSLQAMSLNGGSGSAPNSSASLETLALQINRMQQMQDWMLLQKEREVQMLRQELAEANQKLHTTQLEHALLKEKMAQQKIQHEQELKYLQLAAAAGNTAAMAPPQNLMPNNNTSSNNNNNIATTAPESGLKELKAPAKDTPNAINNNSISNTTGTTSGANNMTVGAPTSSARKQPPAAAKPVDNNSGSPPKSTTVTPKVNGAVTGSSNKPATVAKSSTPPKKTPPKKNPPPAEPPKKTAMKQPPPPATSNNTSNNNNNNASSPSNNNNNVTSSNKTAPLERSIPKHPPSKNDFGIPTDINVDDDAPPTVPLQEDITLGTLGKTQSWRASVMERNSRNISSDRFEPRYIGSPADRAANANGNAANTEPEHEASFPPNDQQSLTVASSTYGEDRQKVVNQNLLDPYGDKGIYTGLILKSTGMPHGSGRMIYEEDQRIYEGEWRHGRWHGFGRAKFANGDSYEGEYRFDQRHGHGKYSWSDGRSYDGAFSEDRRHGKGLFVWPDGAIYEGEFANGQREGHGSYKFSDGGQYTGSWKDGRYNGFGTCSWEDGRCYRGEWRNGMAHGKGIETYADGTVRHDGQWDDDEPVR